MGLGIQSVILTHNTSQARLFCSNLLSSISSSSLSTAAGSGVNVYVIDTGIKFSHQEFGHMDGTPGSRAVPGFSVFGDNNSSDCYGHGTHTAATVGGQHLDSANSGSCYTRSWCPSCYTVTWAECCCTVTLYIAEAAVFTVQFLCT